ncbi:hypothetical protein ET475_07215 [Microbacterium protaetiae]|uniref:DUF1648 domain-containing protein n=1 Tax=Microbacterium protaetiae TaxID=2509458 RepID=A0A4P6EC58_9MICO|nr:hypothetical protein [Microbacterium protaetiae]QAY59800.1 hypothetical protein ET475_07215 [Microbacterium protaetiae]
MTSAPWRIVRQTPAGLLVSAAATWVAPVAVVINRLTAQDLPGTVPTQWGVFGEAEGWMPLQQSFWSALLPALVGGVLITFIVLAVGDDIPRVRGGLGLGAGALVTSGIGFTWFSSLAAAAHETPTGSSLLEALGPALAIATVVFVGAAAPRRSRRP